jgi:hypothetical protein
MALRTIQSKPKSKSLDKIFCKFTVCLPEIAQALRGMLHLKEQTEIHDEPKWEFSNSFFSCKYF